MTDRCRKNKRTSDLLVIAWVIVTAVLIGAAQWLLAMTVFVAFFLGAVAVLLDPMMTERTWDESP